MSPAFISQWMLFFLGGCWQRAEPVEFPAGLEPLESSSAPAPEGEGYPEEIIVVTGESEDYHWAHGRAYVHAGLSTTWEALRDIEVNLDRRKVDSYTVEYDVDPDFEYAYRIHNVVHDVITVEFDVDWRHGQTEAGDGDALVAIRFAKTEGTTFIRLLEGSLLVWEVAPGICEIEMVEHLDAADGDGETIASYLADLHADVVAYVHGEPLPEFVEE